MQQKKIPQQPPVLKHDEDILVIKREELFKTRQAWHGLRTGDFDELFQHISTHREFHPRSLMETDPTYKQIIPYLVFTHQGRFFLMQRQGHASEQRLKNKFSLGIGGHVRKEDLTATDIMGWAKREFNEEVYYEGTYTVKPLGILNDDTNPVGEVHLGLVLLIEGTTEMISVRSELKSGSLYSLNECEAFYPQMEGWSQFVFAEIKRA
jgi:predicted NUDIX family phosphoesterase